MTWPDMIDNIADSVVPILALLAFLFIGWRYRTSDSEAFHTVHRQAGLLHTAASLFTIVGAPHFVIFTTLSYFYGWWPVVFYTGTFVGFCILSFVASKIRSYSVSDVHTYADIAFQELGRSIASCFSFIGILFTVGVVVAQIIVSADVISRISELNYLTCVLLFSGTVIGYLCFGGYRSLLYTDVVQGFVMFIFSAILVYLLWVVDIGSSAEGIAASTSEFSIHVPLAPLIPLLFLGGVLAVTGAPEVWQRILTARSDSIAKQSLFTSAVLMFTWGLFVVSVGNYISGALPTSVPGEAFVDFILTLPPWLLGGIVVLLIAAMISTADTEVFTASMIIHKEKKRYYSPYDTVARSISLTRSIIIFIGVMAACGAIFLRGLIDAWGILLNLTYISAPLAVALVLGRGGSSRFRRQVVFSMSFVAALTAFLITWWFIGDFFSWWAIIIVLAASVPIIFSSGKPAGAVEHEIHKGQP